ncbi:hypothetical protein HanRHA438_Chr07g0293301 [Helianthus annuus]|nr:hypothetical protein HanRHA438_Chr07g0293301 [Helianthus annuus]
MYGQGYHGFPLASTVIVKVCEIFGVLYLLDIVYCISVHSDSCKMYRKNKIADPVVTKKHYFYRSKEK